MRRVASLVPRAHHTRPLYRLLATLAIIAALGAVAWWSAGRIGAREAEARGIPLPRPPVSASETEQRTRDLALYEARAARDPLSAEDRAMLAQLYLQRAREAGDPADLLRAERAARGSLALRTARNTKAAQLLASTLLAQHRFPEARAVAESLVARAPDIDAFHALLGECQLELGAYAAANATFAPLVRAGDKLSVAPRLARWYELTGSSATAHRLLVRARDAAIAQGGLPREQIAWFHLRVGELDLRAGRLDSARLSFEAGLAVHPDDHRILGALARLALARGAYPAAIAFGDRAIARVLDPATLGVVSDAYTALGDTARAEEYARAMTVAALRQPGPIHRAWGLWLLDHDRDVPRVLAKAREELATRHDVYGYDLLAWALHKAGRHEEAERAMRRALAQGTEDPLLARHAAEIERARR